MVNEQLIENFNFEIPTVFEQHHPKTKDWNSYKFTAITENLRFPNKHSLFEQQKAWLIGHILGDLGTGARLNKGLTWSVNLKFDYKEKSVDYLKIPLEFRKPKVFNHLWSNYPNLRQRTEPHKRVILESIYTDSNGKEHLFWG